MFYFLLLIQFLSIKIEKFKIEISFSPFAKMGESQPSERRRRVVILRHGERVDMVFGKLWTKESFKDAQYIRTDLNMPEALPTRDSIKDWECDSPLTTLGSYQAQLVGSSLKSYGVKFTNVFVSPSYRCLETAKNVLAGMDLENEIPLNIEYGLFEYIGMYKTDKIESIGDIFFGGLPNFLSEKEQAAIFKVNSSYKPTMSRSELFAIEKESLNEEFYDRNAKATMEILRKVDGDVLIVGHAANLDTCTRKLIGKGYRKESKTEMVKLILKIPYLFAIAMEQVGESSYQLIDPPCMTLTHGSCKEFNWEHLDDK